MILYPKYSFALKGNTLNSLAEYVARRKNMYMYLSEFKEMNSFTADWKGGGWTELLDLGTCTKKILPLQPKKKKSYLLSKSMTHEFSSESISCFLNRSQDEVHGRVLLGMDVVRGHSCISESET